MTLHVFFLTMKFSQIHQMPFMKFSYSPISYTHLLHSFFKTLKTLIVILGILRILGLGYLWALECDIIGFFNWGFSSFIPFIFNWHFVKNQMRIKGQVTYTIKGGSKGWVAHPIKGNSRIKLLVTLLGQV